MDHGQSGKNIFALHQIFSFTAFYTGATAYTHFTVYCDIALFIGIEGIKKAFSRTIGCFLLRAIAVADAPDRRIFFWIQQAVQLVGIKILLPEFFQLLFGFMVYRCANQPVIQCVKGRHMIKSFLYGIHGVFPTIAFNRKKFLLKEPRANCAKLLEQTRGQSTGFSLVSRDKALFFLLQ